VPYIAYPGHATSASRRHPGRRLPCRFSTQSGFNRRDVDRFRIRRIDVYGTDTPAMLLRKVRMGSNDGSLGHAASYYLDRLKSRLPGAAR
jgi:hypothetical protein